MGRAEDILKLILQNGDSEITRLIDTRKSEELFLDFKKSADDGKNPHLHDHDRQHLKKAISGFGNSEGGIVVWGVECRTDKKTGADVPTGLRLPHNRRV